MLLIESSRESTRTARARGAGLLAPLVIAAATSLGAGCGVALPPDHSTAHPTADPNPSGAILLDDPETLTASMSGVVAATTPTAREGGVKAVRVELAGEAPVAERTFLVTLPPEIPLPFKVGDTITMTLEAVPGPPTWQPLNAVITRESGELLATDGVTSPEGWYVHGQGEARRTARRSYDLIEQYVIFEHAGKTAVSDGIGWRRLSASDGNWFVKGTATELDGDIPPDGGGTISFMIVRAP